jgi:hypothetical protein
MPRNGDKSLNGALQLTLDALADQSDGRLVLDAEHRDAFGHGAIEAFLKAGLAGPHPTASSIVCQGCEQACLMPFESHETGAGISTFVVCDKPQDLGRIPIDSRRLDRWSVNLETIAKCLSSLLVMTTNTTFPVPEGLASLGRVDLPNTEADAFLVLGETQQALSHPRIHLAARPLILHCGRPPETDFACLDLRAALLFKNGRLRFLHDAAIKALAEARSQPQENLFRRAGVVWELRFSGTGANVRHTKGMLYLAVLLGSPNEDIHAVDLCARANSQRQRLKQLGVEASDHQARHDLLRGRRSIEAELKRALSENAHGKVTDLRSKLAAIDTQLRRDFGLHGKVRVYADVGDRARQTVQKSIKVALKNISYVHALLHAHIEDAISTGFSCAYRPRQRILWKIIS